MISSASRSSTGSAASAFAVAPVERREAPDGVGPSSWQTAIAALRSAMTERILAGAARAAPAALPRRIITGQTHAIPGSRRGGRSAMPGLPVSSVARRP